MELYDIVQYIANMGFPAVLCVVMIWLNHEQAKAHKEELKSLKEAIDNNTQALSELRLLMYTETHERGA